MLALLPRHKIDIFDGNYMKWPSFISAFKHLVHDVVSSDAQRFAILIGYLSPRVRDEQGHTLSDPSQYWNALQELEDTYDHPHFIAKAYLDDLMAHGTVQERDSKSLLTFIQKLRGVVTVLTDHGFEHELRSGVILGNLLAKLPYWVQTKWSRYAFGQMESYGSVLDVEDLALWLRNLAMAQRMLTLSKPFETSQVQEKTEHQHKQKKRDSSQTKESSYSMDQRPKSSYNFTPTLLATGTPGPSSKESPAVTERCFCCNARKHSLFKCEKFVGLDVASRTKMIVDLKRCTCCLGIGHDLSNCASTFLCGIDGCDEKHNTLLHQASTRKLRASSSEPNLSDLGTHHRNPLKSATVIAIQKSASNAVETAHVLLQAVVQLDLSANGKRVQATALLDSAADSVMMLDELAYQLDITGQDDLECVTTFNRTDLIGSKDAPLSIGLPGGPELFKVTACTTSELHINYRSLDWDRAVAEWPYLADLPPPPPPDSKISIIIGMDVVRAHLQRELVEPPPGVDGPIAIRTDLGWAYIGPVDQSFIHSLPSSNVKRFGDSTSSIVSSISSNTSPPSIQAVIKLVKPLKKKPGSKPPIKMPHKFRSNSASRTYHSGSNHPTKTHLDLGSCDGPSAEIFACKRPSVPPDKTRNGPGPTRTVSPPQSLHRS